MFRKFSIPVIATVLLLALALGCKKKNNTQSPVPYQTVNITLYPSDPMNFKLQVIGGWKYIAGGVNGIVVYRKNNQNISSDFVALERTSTYLPNDAGAAVKVKNDNFTCRDTVSGSEWKIIDGSVSHGPATIALKQYNVTYDSGTDALHITN